MENLKTFEEFGRNRWSSQKKILIYYKKK